jgi:hypothetical protein
MKLVEQPISLTELKEMAEHGFGTLVKAVVDVEGDDWIEFDSMINLRPASGNRSRGVDDPAIRDRIRAIVARMVQR